MTTEGIYEGVYGPPAGDFAHVSGGLTDLISRLADGAPRDLLTRPEAARALGVSLSTIDRMRADGQLADVKIRGRVMVPRAEVRRLVADTHRRRPAADVRHPVGVAVPGRLW